MKAGQIKSSSLVLSLGFGLLSLLLGYIQFQIPGIEGGTSDLREIPLLVSVIYLPNPLYMILVSAITSLGVGSDASMLSSLLMHSVGLVAFWYVHRFLRRFARQTLILVLLWCVGVAIYYLGILVPLIAFTDHWLGLNLDFHSVDLYYSMIHGVQFELFASALVSAFYVAHYYTRLRLKENLRVLEIRNEQLSEYAFINSHLLRAPLARLLGLANLLKLQTKEVPEAEFVDRFHDACKELDQVVRSISEILAEEDEKARKERKNN